MLSCTSAAEKQHAKIESSTKQPALHNEGMSECIWPVWVSAAQAHSGRIFLQRLSGESPALFSFLSEPLDVYSLKFHAAIWLAFYFTAKR